jgi:hypothetical protein
MKWTMTAALILLVLAPTPRADDGPEAKSQAAADEYQALVDEYREVRRPREFAEKFLALAAKYARDTVAVDALAWVLINDSTGPAAPRAADLLVKDHLASTKLGQWCQRIGQTQSLPAQRLLAAATEKSPHREVRAQACFHLAALLQQHSANAALLKGLSDGQGDEKNRDERKRIEQFFGEEYTKHVAALDPDKVARQREELLETILKSYADVKLPRGTMGEVAKRELFDIRHLSIGRTAPEIEGEDLGGVKFKLSEYRGKVVLLDFWGHW